MGCEMLAAIGLDGPVARERLERTPGWFAAWDRRLSRFRPDSELCRLNARAGTVVPVSPVLLEVVGIALDAARATAGLVTPTLLDQLETAGYDRDFAAIDSGAGAGQPHRATASGPDSDAWRRIEIDRRAGAIRLPAGVRIDLGGSAKGWAADRAARSLGRLGPALVDAGGDIASTGPPPGEPGWPVAVADPRAPGESLGLVCLTQGGLATSGRDRRRWWRDGRWQHHLIDPRTGLPAETDVLTATVTAGSAVDAELATKYALLLGAERGLQWLDGRGLGGILVLEDDRVLSSKYWTRYLW